MSILLKTTKNIAGTFGLGYAMTPFGDFVEENFWVRYKECYNTLFYLRQYENWSTIFPACGVLLDDLFIHPKIKTTLSIDAGFWGKTAGFLPENESLGNGVGVQIGTTISLFTKR